MKSLFLFLISLLLINKASFGFTLNTSTAAAFEQDEVKVNVSNIDCSALGVTNDELLSMAEEASERFWNRVPTSRLTLVRGEVINVAANFGTDAIVIGNDPNPALSVSSDILISCNTSAANFPTTQILGVTLPNNVSGDKITGSLVLINSQGGNQFADRAREEQISILAHEIGHALGLGHSTVQDSLMFFQTRANRQSLGEDDIHGITFLYPREQPFGCGTIEFTQSNGTMLFSLFLGILLSLLMTTISRLKGLRNILPSFDN